MTRWGGAPAQFEKRLRQFFVAMADGGPSGAEEILYVDGGLFEDDTPLPNGGVLPLDGESLRILTEVSTLDWSAIEPSVLGTLFELIVEPVLMAPLRRDWMAAKALADKRELLRAAAPSSQRTRQLGKLDGELKGVVRGFREQLAGVPGA